MTLCYCLSSILHLNTGFLEEAALALFAVSSTVGIFHPTPTYYRYLSNNEIAGSYLSSPAHTALNHSAHSFACLI